MSQDAKELLTTHVRWPPGTLSGVINDSLLLRNITADAVPLRRQLLAKASGVGN